MKWITLISRKKTLNYTEFQDYYEYNHCLKAMKYFPFHRYERNYIFSGSKDLDFDCICKFEVDDGYHLHDIYSCHSRQIMNGDTCPSMSSENVRYLRVREHILNDGIDSIDFIGEKRYVLLFKFEGMIADVREARMEEAAKIIVEKLNYVRKLSYDIVELRREDEFPFDACLWVSADIGFKSMCRYFRKLSGMQSLFEVNTYNSSPEVLQYRFTGNM